MGQLETVKVVADNEAGFVIINKADMTDAHKLYVEKAVTAKKTATTAKANKES